MNDFEKMTLDELRSARAMIEGEIARRAGEPIEVWNGMDGQVTETPPGGALLHVEWAVSDRSYSRWYASEEAAKAALLHIADAHGRAVSENGLYVDLTAYRCHESRAYVIVRATQSAAVP